MRRIRLILFLILIASPAAKADYDPFAEATSLLQIRFTRDDDRDYDGLPDGWTRRSDAGFPPYIDVRLDWSAGAREPGSLRFSAGGGAAAVYSPPLRISSEHEYLLSAAIRTEALSADAAVCSVSVLNDRHERIARYLTRGISGNSAGWQQVRLGPLPPHAGQCFLVVGCHLVRGNSLDLHGKAYFDDLSIGQLPAVTLQIASGPFCRPDEPIRLTAEPSGLEPEKPYTLSLSVRDRQGRIVAETTRTIMSPAEPAEEPNPSDRHPRSVELLPTAPGMATAQALSQFNDFNNLPQSETLPSEPSLAEVWEIPGQPIGHYRIQAILRSGENAAYSELSFVTCDSVRLFTRDFGWSVDRVPADLQSNEFLVAASESQIGCVSWPLWHDAGKATLNFEKELFLLAEQNGLELVGQLDPPPQAVRALYGENWPGMADLFRLPPERWNASLPPLIARIGPRVSVWLLSRPQDDSFQKLSDLTDVLETVRREFGRIGRNVRLGLPWPGNRPNPPVAFITQTVPTSILGSASAARRSMTETVEGELADPASVSPSTGRTAALWAILQGPGPRKPDQFDNSNSDGTAGGSLSESDRRGKELFLRILAAKHAAAERILFEDVFNPETGLLTNQVEPTELFLPWRTAAVTLSNRRDIGFLALEGGSRNRVLLGDQNGTVVLWNEAPTVEKMVLGAGVTCRDIWGQPIPIEEESTAGAYRVPATAVPCVLTGCSGPLLEWQTLVRVEESYLESRYGAQSIHIVGRNTFSQGVSGTLTLQLPRDWEIEPSQWPLKLAANESFRLTASVTLPADVSLGEHPMLIECHIEADRLYDFAVPQSIDVGDDDILISVTDRELPDGSLEIVQTLQNRTAPPESLDFRCSLFAPERARQRQYVIKLGPGEDVKRYYLPNASSLSGQTLWLRAEQENGPRVLNYRWKIGND